MLNVNNNEIVILPGVPTEPEHGVYASAKLEQDDEIRLIDLHPGELDDPIVCDLRSVSLNHVRWTSQSEQNVDSRSYEALSYVWGDPSVRLPISCSGVTMQVTTNLHAALRRLRRQDRLRTLWIDAICIDQANIPERNQQVRRLQQLYAGAKQVVVWLGETDDEEPFKELGPVIALMSQDQDSTLLGMPDDIDLERLMAFFMNAWFQRKWVIQEFVFAQSVRFVKGKSEYSTWLKEPSGPNSRRTNNGEMQDGAVISKMSANATILMPEEAAPNEAAAGMLHAGVLLKYWVETQLQGLGWSLSCLLRRTPDYKTSLIADRTIAVLNLACDLSDEERAYLLDYSLGIDELLMRTARMVLSKDGLAGITRPIGPGVSWQSQSVDRAGLIPSWVPRHLFTTGPDTCDVEFFSDKTKSRSTLVPQDGRLTVSGSFIGAITSLTAPASATMALASSPHCRKRLREWHKFLNQTRSATQDSHKKFWHLLLSFVDDKSSRGGSMLRACYDEQVIDITLNEVLELNDHEVQGLAHDSIHALVWHLVAHVGDQAMLCLTATGCLGFARGNVKVGDQAFVCSKEKALGFIVRARDDGDFSVVGDARFAGDDDREPAGGAEVREIFIS